MITKHPGTGGAVTVETVTAQLLYEIDRRRVPRAGRGRPVRHDPPRPGRAGPGAGLRRGRRRRRRPTSRSGTVRLGGFRNAIDVRAHRARHRGEGGAGPGQVEQALAGPAAGGLTWTLARTDHADADTEEAASALLHLSVQDRDPDTVGRAFSRAADRAGAGVVPGLPRDRAARGRHARTACSRPSTVPQSDVDHVAVLPDGTPGRGAGAADAGRWCRSAAFWQAPAGVRADPAGAAGHDRRRAVGRQGRRRQHRGLGPHRRRAYALAARAG